MLKTLLANQFSRYVIASGIALCLDYGSYWLLATITDLALPVAAAIGYGIGLMAAYFFIAERVFKDGWLKNRKHFEIALFIASGGLGIIVTYASVSLYTETISSNLHSSKLAAVGVSFLIVYLFRRYVVFRVAKK